MSMDANYNFEKSTVSKNTPKLNKTKISCRFYFRWMHKYSWDEVCYFGLARSSQCTFVEKRYIYMLCFFGFEFWIETCKKTGWEPK